MIGYLEGVIKYCDLETCLLLCQGVGYEISINAKTSAGTMGQSEMAFYTHHHIREDTQTLFGFLTQRDRDLFRVLIQLQGVGPKLGLVVLESISETGILQAVAEKDVDRFKCIKGVGARMAERMVMELKPKLAKWKPVVNEACQTTPVNHAIADVMEALAQLGYNHASLVDKVRSHFEPGMSRDVLLKKSLQSLSKI
jgi:Holliday junction DNA helicase RuvA